MVAQIPNSPRSRISGQDNLVATYGLRRRNREYQTGKEIDYENGFLSKGSRRDLLWFCPGPALSMATVLRTEACSTPAPLSDMLCWLPECWGQRDRGVLHKHPLLRGTCSDAFHVHHAARSPSSLLSDWCVGAGSVPLAPAPIHSIPGVHRPDIHAHTDQGDTPHPGAWVCTCVCTHTSTHRQNPSPPQTRLMLMDL